MKRLREQRLRYIINELKARMEVLDTQLYVERVASDERHQRIKVKS